MKKSTESLSHNSARFWLVCFRNGSLWTFGYDDLPIPLWQWIGDVLKTPHYTYKFGLISPFTLH